VTDATAKHLARIPSLEKVMLRFTHLTDAGVRGLVALPRLETLWVEGSKVTDAALRDLRKKRGRLFVDRHLED
jgi:hypothetical protein